MKKGKYTIFLLDADDTLFDFSACCANALRRAMEAGGFPFQEEYPARYLQINDALWRQLERGEITHEELFALRFSRFLRAIGAPEEGADELNVRYVDALAGECVPLDGAEDFLRRLRGLGRIYVITNGTARVQRSRFRRFQLETYVDGVFISEEIGAYKPSAEYFSFVAGHIAGFSPDRALVIGDSLSSDIFLAENAGVDSVWFNPKGKPLAGQVSPTFTARSYAEILRLLAG